MDSIEQEEYDKWSKEQDIKVVNKEYEVLNDLAQKIDKSFMVSIYSYTNRSFSLFVFGGEVMTTNKDYTEIKSFLEGYNFAKSSLPF